MGAAEPHRHAVPGRISSGVLPQDPLLGQTLDGRYHLLEHVGTGGMASVYRACQLNVGRDVAVKVLNSILLTSPHAATRFEMEARIISRLRHPNTLKLIDFGKLPDGRPYLVTEFLVGTTLERNLHNGPLDPTWTLVILRQISDAMAEAHEQQVIHRDLKPGNIFLERVGDEDIVKVLDFGIAKLEGCQNTITAVGSVCGTPCYMSPEQAAGEEIDPRSDLYSLGVIAYECLAGRPPFISPQPAGLLFLHINEPPPPLSELAPNVPPEVAALVMSLLEKDVARRPESARHVRTAIDQILLRGSNELSGSTIIDRPERFEMNRHALAPAVMSTYTRQSVHPPREANLPSTIIRAPSAVELTAASDRKLQVIGAGLLAAALTIAAGSWAFLRTTVDGLADGQVAVAAEVEPLHAVELEDVREKRGADQVVFSSAAVTPEPDADAADAREALAAAPPKKPQEEPGKMPVEVPSGFVDFQLQ